MCITYISMYSHSGFSLHCGSAPPPLTAIPCRPRAVTAANVLRKGANGVSTNGVTAYFMFFGRGTFWVLPLTYFGLPKSAKGYLFPQSVKHL